MIFAKYNYIRRSPTPGSIIDIAGNSLTQAGLRKRQVKKFIQMAHFSDGRRAVVLSQSRETY